MNGFDVVCLGTTADTVRLLVCAVDAGSSPPPVTVRLNGTAVPCTWKQTSIGRSSDRLWWAKPVVGNLTPGTRHAAEVVLDDEGVVASASATTLPPSGAPRLQLVAGSCFDGLGGHAGVLSRAYDILAEAATCDLSYNLWLGDQVYVDAP